MNTGWSRQVLGAAAWLGAVAAGHGAGPAPARPFAWKLGDGPSPSYLVGSVHVARADVYPLPPAVEAAFEACDTLVVEADPEALGLAGMQQLLARYAYYTDDRTLADAVDEATLAKLAGFLERFNLSPVRFERMKPWYVAQVVSVLELARLGVDAARGIDLHFLRKARGLKPIVELEGVAFQLMFLDHFNDTEQRLMLEYTLRDLERMEEVFDDIFAAWRAGDPEGLERLFTEFLEENDGLEAAFEKLMAGRNGPMLRKIRRLLEGDGGCFIVVGAGHLVGERGLLQQLAAEGIAVEQLPAAPPPAAE